MTYYYTTQYITDELGTRIVVNIYSNKDITAGKVTEAPIARLAEKSGNEKHDFDVTESFRKQQVTVEMLDHLFASFALPSSAVPDPEATIRGYFDFGKEVELIQV